MAATGNVARSRQFDDWDEFLTRVDALTDGLGKRVDTGIREVVAGLWAHGVDTSQSCEGHDDWGCPMPWVDIMAPHHRTSIHEMSAGQRETWRRENLALQARASDLIAGFYVARVVPPQVTITLKPKGRDGAARLESNALNEGGRDRHDVSVELVTACRAEMAAFGGWMRARFLHARTHEK